MELARTVTAFLGNDEFVSGAGAIRRRNLVRMWQKQWPW
jgi:hypothetical protein